jgi:4-hydroxy-3-polyprenylbenzoate decarboxylase
MGRDVDLADLPVPRSWPGEASPVITAGQVFTRHPVTGVRNVGLYPLEVRDHNTLAIHWTPHHDGWRNYNEHRRLGRPMPVAVALGGDPLLTYAASAPLPADTDECVFANFLRGRPIELVKCRSIDLEAPAEAEFILEGMIDVAAPLEQAGPIAAGTGYYTLPDALPMINVTAITHRSNPVFPAMIAGTPPMEDFWLGKATERIFLPFVKLFVPEIVDMHVPGSGAFRNLLFVSIRKDYPQQARRVMHALWGLKGLLTTKILVVVDDSVDVHDEDRVWFQVGANVHPGRDVVFCEGPTHFDDHAAPVHGMGHKMGLDATPKLPEEGHPRSWPEMLAMPAEIQERIEQRWDEYGLERPAEERVAT